MAPRTGTTETYTINVDNFNFNDDGVYRVDAVFEGLVLSSNDAELRVQELVTPVVSVATVFTANQAVLTSNEVDSDHPAGPFTYEWIRVPNPVDFDTASASFDPNFTRTALQGTDARGLNIPLTDEGDTNLEGDI